MKYLPVLSLIICSYLACLTKCLAFWSEGDETNEIQNGKNLLIFGGNGFLGSETVSELIENGYTNITILNRGGKYWDASERVFSTVTKSIKCDRTKLEEDCQEFMDEIENTIYDVVIDFTAFKESTINETLKLLKDKVGLYILVSPDQIYDVGSATLEKPTEETDAVRPEDEEDADFKRKHFHVAEERMKVEEALQANQKEGGPNYVILRLPDVIGPRDTTSRWWIYQVWVRLSTSLTEHPIHIPSFLEAYGVSFVYVKDVANVLVQIVHNAAQEDMLNEAFNLAWPKAMTTLDFLDEMKRNLDLEDLEVKILDALDHQNHFYTYPACRSGSLNTTKATKTLHFEPTPWEAAVKETVEFFEKAMTDEQFVHQRNEIIQIVGNSLFDKNLMKFYEALEEVYNIDLKHFKYTKDEL